MILSCNSCEKKFVVPDDAISATGRLVQCSSCGNKWKQLPIETKVEIKETTNILSETPKKIINIKKIKKKAGKKKSGPNLYSPEYLAKKHGIDIKKPSLVKKEKTSNSRHENIFFGFYNSLIFFTVLLIFLSRSLFFFQDVIIKNYPIAEFYLNYFFENINNVFEILKNLITSY